MTNEELAKHVAKIQSDLRQFTGSETWYRHWFASKITFTDGVKYLAEACGAFWLIDEIVFGQSLDEVRAEEFQAWKLVVTGSAAVLTCEDGNDNKVYSKKIDFTDFPLPEIDLWFENNVIYLPSEH